MEGQPPSHAVPERKQGHSLHHLNAKELGICVMASELAWYFLLLSQSLWTEEGEGMGRVECCEVCDGWGAARCGMCGMLLGVGRVDMCGTCPLYVNSVVSTREDFYHIYPQTSIMFLSNPV